MLDLQKKEKRLIAKQIMIWNNLITKMPREENTRISIDMYSSPRTAGATFTAGFVVGKAVNFVSDLSMTRTNRVYQICVTDAYMWLQSNDDAWTDIVFDGGDIDATIKSTINHEIGHALGFGPVGAQSVRFKPSSGLTVDPDPEANPDGPDEELFTIRNENLINAQDANRTILLGFGYEVNGVKNL